MADDWGDFGGGDDAGGELADDGPDDGAPGLERQTSDDFGDWYTQIPDKDAWGADDDGGSATPTKTVEPKMTGGKKKAYTVLSKADVAKCREAAIADLADISCIPNDEADIILRHLRYDKKLIDKFTSDAKFQATTRRDAGVMGEAKKAAESKDAEVQCSNEYCGKVPRAEAHALNCGHYYCKDCWEGYIDSEINSGQGSVFSKCMGMDKKSKKKCTEAITHETIKKFAAPEQLERLDNWICDQFVESEKTIQWCSKPGCGFAVEYTLGGAMDVVCKCETTFCFHCGGPAHQPAPCDLARKWLSLLNDADAASEMLINSMTKPCPKCGTRIEKNRACNHMKCSKCKFDFCWQCLQAITIDANTHPSWYVCLVREKQAAAGEVTVDEKKRVEMNAQMTKQTWHQQHTEDCQKDAKSAKALLGKVAAAEGKESIGKLGWLQEVVNIILEAERFLEWTFVYTYYMGDSGRKETFVNWQKSLEEKSDGLLHDIEKAFTDEKSIVAFVTDAARVTQIKKTASTITKNMTDMSTVGAQIEEVLRYEADTKTSQWICRGCKKEVPDKKPDGVSVLICEACGACRAHGDGACLVKACKDAGSR